MSARKVRSKFASHILSELQLLIKRDLTAIEADFFKNQVQNINPSRYGASHIEDLKDVLIQLFLEDLKDPKKISKAFAEPQHMDMHEIMKKEIFKGLKKSPAVVEEKSVANVNTHKILGFTSAYQIRKALNPSSLVSEAYVVLDRRYHKRDDSQNHTFTWDFSPGGLLINKVTTVSTMAPVQNIVGVEMLPFRMPRTVNSILSTNRISVSIEEFRAHGYISNQENRRYQFLFKITQTTPVSTYDPLILQDLTGENTDLNFYQPIANETNTLTVSFGNPFRRLTLDADQLPATISASGVETLLTFTEPHFMTVGDYIIIESFSTTDTTADSVEIDQINDLDGWAVTALTSTTLTIGVDLSGLTGAIAGNPHDIYLESKRFAMHMKIKYIKDS